MEIPEWPLEVREFGGRLSEAGLGQRVPIAGPTAVE
jgi:hypothetical protein